MLATLLSVAPVQAQILPSVTIPAPTTLPTGASVVSGVASLQQTGANLTITQSSQQLITNWQTFNIGSDASVRFVQPSASSVALNRVQSADPSAIYGSLSSNGQVFLLNPAGVIFGSSARVDVGGLVASSLELSDAGFLAGRHAFEKTGGAAGAWVVNAGQIRTAEGGYVAFLAPRVENQGTISAAQGTVALVAADKVSLNFDGPRLINFTVDQGAVDAQVKNSGLLQASGGAVLLSARAADSLTQSVVNQSGVIEASSLTTKGGRIVLEGDALTLAAGSRTEATGPTGGGEVLVGGDWQGGGPLYQATTVHMVAGASIDVSATQSGDGGKAVLWSEVAQADSRTTVQGSIFAKGGLAGGKGGQIETSGYVAEVGGATISAAAPNGVGGLWLIDPTDAIIDQTIANTYVTTLNGGTSVLNEVTGNISIDSGVTIGKTAGGDATLTLKATGNIVFNSSVAISSSAGKLNTVLWADSDSSGSGGILLNSGSSIISNGGDITMGGGANPLSNAAFGDRGVDLDSNVTLTAGAGSVSLRGTSNRSTGDTGIGVRLFSTVAVTGGNITVVGTGSANAGSADRNWGVSLESTSSITGTGTVAVTGTGGLGNGNGSTGNSNDGLFLDNNSTITATGSGSLTVTGTGGGTGSSTTNHGVRFTGTSKIGATGSGTLSVTGTGGSVTTGGASIGVALTTASEIFGASGTVAVRGLTPSGAGSQVEGLNIDASEIYTTAGGGITLTGTGGSAATGSATGVKFVGSTIAKTGSGNLTVVGTAGNGSASSPDGISLSGTALGTSGYSGNVILRGDQLTFPTANTLTSTGTLTIEPLGASFTSTLSFPLTNLTVTAGLTGLTLGKSGNTANITVGGATSIAGPISLFGGNIALNGNLTTTTSNKDILLKASGNITQANGVAVTTSGGNVIYWADSDATSGGYVQLASTAATATSIITTNGGGLWIGGGSGTASWTPSALASPLTVDDGFAKGTSANGTGVFLGSGTISTSGGNIAIYGETAANGSEAVQPGDNSSNKAGSGIYTIFRNGLTGVAKLDSGAGTILMHGRNVATNTSQQSTESIYLNGVTLVSAATSGDAIKLIGDSSGATAGTGMRGVGVTAIGWVNQPVSISATGGGDITIEGTSISGPSFSFNYGVRFASGGSSTALSTTNGGNINITGTVRDSLASLSVGFDSATDSINSSGNLTIIGTTNNGNNKPIFLAGPVTVAGTTSFTASGQNITATNASNNFTGGVRVVSGNNVSIRDANALVLGNANGDSTVSGTLTALAAGAITQAGALLVTGTTSLTSGANAITLTNSSNDFTGAVSISNSGANNVSLRDTNALDLGTVSVGSGTFTVQSGGALTQSGVITQAASAGAASFTAGANAITLANASNDFTGSVSLSNSGANNVSLRDTNALDLGTVSVGSGTFTVQSGGALTQSGVITQAASAGAASITAGANAITLTNASNDFTGAVSLSNSGANNVSLRNTNALDLGTVSVGSGTLTVQSGGALTQSGVITQAASAGAATFTAGAFAITLANASNDFTGSVSLSNSGANNVSLRDANALDLGTVSVGSGTFTVQSGGALTQSGVITQAASAGAATFTAGANAITLTNSSNDFTGAVSLSNSGANNVALTDANALTLDSFTLGSGTFTATGTSVTLSGDITSTGSQTYNGAVLVGGATVTLAAGTGALSLNGTVNSSAAGTHHLVLNSTGLTTLSGAVGTTTALTSLTTNSGGTTALNGGAVTTTGAQTYGDAITLGANTTLTGVGSSFASTIDGAHTLTISDSGTPSFGGALGGTTALTGLALLGGGNFTLTNTSNRVGTLAGNVGNLAVVNAGAMTIGTVGATQGITGTGTLTIATVSGDLTVAQAVVTTNTTTSAVVLNAGKSAAAGTAAGGELIVTGSPTVSVGAGGRATLFTSSVAGSTGLTSLVGSGSGNFRYNSDEVSDGFSTALGAGVFAIYRQHPPSA